MYDDKVIYIENSGFYTWKKYKMKTIDTTRSNLGVPFDSTRWKLGSIIDTKESKHGNALEIAM